MSFKSLFISIIIIVGFTFLSIWQSTDSKSENVKSLETKPQVIDKIVEVEITPNSTYGILMEENEVDPNVAAAIFTVSEDVYDLTKIRVGRTLDLYYDKQTDQLKKLVYQIDSEEELYVTLQKTEVTDQATSTIEAENEWLAERRPIDYQIKIKISDGKVATSLYQAAIDKEIDIRAIIELANAYQWTIDFAMDPRVGDTFEFIYEERYRDGQYIMPGQILAAKYINDGTEHQIYYFEETEENQGFFDLDGNSVQKMFLKAPVAYKYISSGFTTGLRYIQAFNISTGHRAIDYAAAYGTPIRAVGDGTVVFAGWQSGYGYKTSIHHNGTYSTNYAHQSKIIVRYGQKVKQGQTIGYVGSTGLSTGPHLHYEMVKHGSKVNPLREVLPPGKPIKEENKERFFNEIEKYQNQIK